MGTRVPTLETVVKATQKAGQLRPQPANLLCIHAWSSVTERQDKRFVDQRDWSKANLALSY